jgi:hypothetical protein
MTAADCVAALAESIYQARLKSTGPAIPSNLILQLLRSLYFASMRTEEGQAITCHVVYLDLNNPDPQPPQRIPLDRWTSIRFAQPIALTVDNLVKVAKASDPRTSSLAVYQVGGGLCIWGLVDQGNRYHDFINYESRSGSARPGLFQVSILGVGYLVAYDGFRKIAELKVDRLLTEAHDVLWDGPIHQQLAPSISTFIEAVQHDSDRHSLSDFWGGNLASLWISSLCRVLLRAQGVRHGGAFLISTEPRTGLNIKYGIEYQRLPQALRRLARSEIDQSVADDTIGDEYLEKDADDMPVGLHLDSVVASYDLEEARSELDGVLWFIALLTRVDGLVLFGPDLTVLGFGVEITLTGTPPTVVLAHDAKAKRVTSVDYNHYGTRHRSMMQYCARVPGSIGFVISQDGAVRLITAFEERVVMWENIRLQVPDYIRVRRRRGRPSK